MDISNPLTENQPATPSPNRVGRKHILCFYCLKRFATQSPLTKHIMADHAEIHRLAAEGKAFNCTLCLKIFRTKAGVHRHLKTHRDGAENAQQDSQVSPYLEPHEPPYVCEGCGERFHIDDYLKIHRVICEEEMRFGGCEAMGGIETEGTARLPVDPLTGRTPLPNAPFRR